MQTKCKSCYYLDSAKKCSKDILNNIDNLIEYDDIQNPIINNYKCLYAFPKDDIFKDQNFTDKEIEDLRISKIPKISLSIVIDHFKHQEKQAHQNYVEYITNFCSNSEIFDVSDIVTLISSEHEDKESYIDYFNSINTNYRWKICAIRVNEHIPYRFLFALDNIKSRVVLYITAGVTSDEIRNILDEMYLLSIVKQQPFIFIKSKGSDLANNIHVLCCNVENLKLLKKNNLQETDTQTDPNLIEKFLTRGGAEALVFDV